jgi:acyl carrier protein
MKKEEIEKIVLSSLKEISPDTEPSEILLGDNIKEALGIDSFDFLQFIIALDEKLKLEIPEHDYGKITTLNSLIDYIQQKMK